MVKKENKSNITYIEPEMNKKRINKKKIVIAIIICSMILMCSIMLYIYTQNVNFRNFCDIYILKKEVESTELPSIEIENLNSSNIFALSNSICTIKNNVLTRYSESGKEEATLKVEITSPLIDTNEEYAAIAENNGTQVYLIYKKDIIWQKKLEGNISRISVNQNGYLCVVLSGTSYKSVIVLYDKSGNELFKTYLSTTIAADADVSPDNKFLAFAEINTSGTLIQSNIKIISVEKAKQTPLESIIYTYKAEPNELIVDIEYQDKGNLICMYDDKIQLIQNNENKEITKLKDNNFADIELYENIVKTQETAKGLFNTNSTIIICNSESKKCNEYSATGMIKNLYCYGNKIGINLGSEIHFIDMNGWLVKKYTSSQEIAGVVMNERIAGIIYKDKIKIINL